MLNSKTFLACFFFVCSLGLAKAAPPDPPNVVIIDGVACNQFCQSYMGWFRKHFGQPVADVSKSEDVSQPEVPSTPVPEVSRAPKNNAKRSAPTLLAKQTQNGITQAVDPAAPKTTAASKFASTSPKAPLPRARPAFPPVQDLSGAVPRSKAPAIASSAEEQPTRAPPSAATSDPAVLHRSEASYEQANASSTELFEPTAAASRDNAKTNAVVRVNPDREVAVLYVRESIKSTSDLANKVIAVDPSDATSRIKTAIEAAGASDVRLSEGARMALLRVIKGEVPAAVVALETPQKAATWTDVPGLKVVRVPLGPSKAGPV